jgi:hypothetical protein
LQDFFAGAVVSRKRRGGVGIRQRERGRGAVAIFHYTIGERVSRGGGQSSLRSAAYLSPRMLSRRAHRLDARLHREVTDHGGVRSHRAGRPTCRGQPPGSPLPRAVRPRGCTRLVPWCRKHRAFLECCRNGGEAQGRANRQARDHRLAERIDPRTKPLGATGSHPRIQAPRPRRPGCDPFARTRSAQSARAYADFTSRC